MTEPKPTYDPQDGPLLSPREEAERFAEASKRLRARVRNDPAYARELLKEIGYFEMMADEPLPASVFGKNSGYNKEGE